MRGRQGARDIDASRALGMFYYYYFTYNHLQEMMRSTTTTTTTPPPPILRHMMRDNGTKTGQGTTTNKTGRRTRGMQQWPDDGEGNKKKGSVTLELRKQYVFSLCHQHTFLGTIDNDKRRDVEILIDQYFLVVLPARVKLDKAGYLFLTYWNSFFGSLARFDP